MYVSVCVYAIIKFFVPDFVCILLRFYCVDSYINEVSCMDEHM